ncbi:hypothetical protein ABPG77_001111, partial [Micractinium sp. CCAP 211/92]
MQMADEAARSGGEDGIADDSLATPLLAPLAAVGGAGDPGGRRCDPGSAPTPHASYAQQYLRMAGWLGALFAGYAVQRACCQIGFLEFFSDASSTALWGAVLA